MPIRELRKNVEFYEETPLDSEEMTSELWKDFESFPAIVDHIRDDSHPGTFDSKELYNPQQIQWYPRGATGMEHNSRMKEMFVELEYAVEEVVGKQRIVEKKVESYRGQPKKW